MMMRWLDEPEMAGMIEAAVQKALASGSKTPDLGGSCGTAEMTGSVVGYLKEI